MPCHRSEYLDVLANAGECRRMQCNHVSNAIGGGIRIGGSSILPVFVGQMACNRVLFIEYLIINYAIKFAAFECQFLYNIHSLESQNVTTL